MTMSEHYLNPEPSAVLNSTDRVVMNVHNPVMSRQLLTDGGTDERCAA